MFDYRQRGITKEYEDGWKRVFGNNKKKAVEKEENEKEVEKTKDENQSA